MARANIPLGGFRYVGSIFGENIMPRELPLQIASGYATALGIGDPIKRASDGTAPQAPPARRRRTPQGAPRRRWPPAPPQGAPGTPRLNGPPPIPSAVRGALDGVAD